MAREDRKPISWGQMQPLITIGTMLVGMALAWGNLGTRIDLLAEKQDQMNQSQTSIQSKLDDHDHRLATIETDIAVIKSTLQTARDQGILSRKTTPANTITLTSKTTPVILPETKVSGQSATSQPQQVTYNNTVIAPTSHPEQKTTNQQATAPTPVPTSISPPSPTPTQQPVLPSVITGIMGLIL